MNYEIFIRAEWLSVSGGRLPFRRILNNFFQLFVNGLRLTFCDTYIFQFAIFRDGEIFAIREVIHLENSVKCCPLKVGLVRVGITVICFGANKMVSVSV